MFSTRTSVLLLGKSGVCVRRGKRQDSDAEWVFEETVYSQLQKQGKQKVQNQDAPKEEKSFLI